jgi:hypothetical protein
MNRIIGMGIGVIWLGLAFISLTKANAGWATGYEDIGFWWTVIAVLLTVAAGGAIIGTWIHTQPRQD